MGVQNFKYFYLFVVYTCAMSVTSVVIMIASFIALAKKGEVNEDEVPKFAQWFLLGIACFIEAILFAFFTFEMGKDSLDIIDDCLLYTSPSPRD